MVARWYALCSKPYKERILWRQLKARGYEVFYPRLRLPTGDVRALKYKSYFPGYLFVKVDFKTVNLSTFQWMPNTEGLVCIDGLPAYVPDSLIEAIKRHINELNSTSKKISANVHRNKFEIESISKDENGIFASDITDDERVRVLLKALDRLKASPELSDA